MFNALLVKVNGKNLIPMYNSSFIPLLKWVHHPFILPSFYVNISFNSYPCIFESPSKYIEISSFCLILFLLLYVHSYNSTNKKHSKSKARTTTAYPLISHLSKDLLILPIYHFQIIFFVIKSVLKNSTKIPLYVFNLS